MKQFGIIKDGKMILNNRDKFIKELTQFEGKEIVIKIIERNNNRTKDQNSLLWSWISILANSTGYTKEEMKELIQVKFLQRERLDADGYTETYIKGTSTLSKQEFNDLMNQISYWSNSTLQITLPTYD
tara:strand:- start:837 stop:1220 length:384 start_codon:yes stop_codon:yes gene_type:complete